MPTTFTDKLLIAISSRALFGMDDSHQVFIEQGVDAYCRYQIDHEEDVLKPGIAFHPWSDRPQSWRCTVLTNRIQAFSEYLLNYVAPSRHAN